MRRQRRTRPRCCIPVRRRYFRSRGPATVHDFGKWSGLTLAEARSGLEAVKGQLRHEIVDGRTYWFPASRRSRKDRSPVAHLLSIYDEYISGYKDRGAIIEKRHADRLRGMGNALNYIVVVDGRIVGTWRRTLKRTSVSIETSIFTRLTRAERESVARAAERYGAFLGLTVVQK